MPFTAPTAEQRFALDHVVRLGELAATDKFAAASDDVIDAVLEGIGQFAAGEWAPLARAGDTVGAKWTPEGVVMPQGYAEAYRAFVEGGWGTIGAPEAFGGQGLPFAIQTAVLETLGTANMGFALCPILTVGAIEALAHHGTPEQQAAYLPRLTSGEWTGTMNLTEPQAGSGSIPTVPEATCPDLTLVRMHGRNVGGWNQSGNANWREVRYLYDYNESELNEWGATLARLAEGSRIVGVIFNNNSGGHAAGNAKQMMRLLGQPVYELSVVREPEQLDLFNF